MIFSGLNSCAIRVQSCRICACRLGALLIGMLALLRLSLCYTRPLPEAVGTRVGYANPIFVQRHDRLSTCASAASAWGNVKVRFMARTARLLADNLPAALPRGRQRDGGTLCGIGPHFF